MSLWSCGSVAAKIRMPGLTLAQAGRAGAGESRRARKPRRSVRIGINSLPTRVIYIGETHNNDADHEYQLDVLKGLHARGVRFAVAWEMFDFTQQSR